MTTLFLIYELKVAVLIAVFYIFWRLLTAKETWHRLNRIVLLSTAIASFVLPLCVITIHKTIEVDAAPIETMVETTLPTTIAIQSDAETLRAHPLVKLSLQNRHSSISTIITFHCSHHCGNLIIGNVPEVILCNLFESILNIGI